MKKFLTVFFILSLCFASVFAEEVPEGYRYWFGNALELRFLKHNKVQFYTCGEYPDTVCDYKLEYKSGIPFITIANSIFPEFSKTYIFLYNKNFCAFYGSDGMLHTSGISALDANECFSVYVGEEYLEKCVRATKELVEGNTTYHAYNVRSKKINKVWGAPNNGVQESIMFGYDDDNQKEEENMDKIIEYEKKGETLLMICSGLISYKNQNLYKENARTKRIKIKLKDKYAKDRDYIIELKDTPQPQILKIDHTVAWPITITILDVYAGEKYSDLCISKIWFYNYGRKLEH